MRKHLLIKPLTIIELLIGPVDWPECDYTEKSTNRCHSSFEKVSSLFQDQLNWTGLELL